MNLLKYKLANGHKPKEGLVYLIKNPAWPNTYKIGITSNLLKRLASYQTYDPNRAYKVETYEFVTDKRLVEKSALNKFKCDLTKGEWISRDNYIDILHYIRSVMDIDLSGIKTKGLLSKSTGLTAYTV